jgi:hypothetical protein
MLVMNAPCDRLSTVARSTSDTGMTASELMSTSVTLATRLGGLGPLLRTSFVLVGLFWVV